MLLESKGAPTAGKLRLRQHVDHRGWFMETYNRVDMISAIGPQTFVQDNLFSSGAWVFRGLHFQVGDAVQGKLVHCLHGRITVVAVDLRRDSPFPGLRVAMELRADFPELAWVPQGFAHGVLAWTPSQVLYKVTHRHSPEHGRILSVFDPDVDMAGVLSAGWENQLVLSDADRHTGLCMEDALREMGSTVRTEV